MLLETPEQIATRFGRAVRSYRDVTGRISYLYRYPPYQIMVQYLEGVSHLEVFTSEDDAEMSERELEIIMRANGEGEQWEKVMLEGAVERCWVVLKTGCSCIYGPSVVENRQYQHAVSVSTHVYGEHNKAATLIDLEIAAENGSSEAQFEVAKAYEDGKYCAADYVKAARWYLAAAENGSLKAQCNLGVLYARGAVPGKDFADANDWFRRAAEAGYDQAQLNLAVSYLRGNGLEKNPALALAWALKAAEEGNAAAQCLVGQIYAHGDAGVVDVSSGSLWLLKAAEAGDVEAMFQLGRLHYGLADFEHWDDRELTHVADAAVWFCKAARLGHQGAKEMRENLKGVIPRKLFDYYESFVVRERN